MAAVALLAALFAVFAFRGGPAASEMAPADVASASAEKAPVPSLNRGDPTAAAAAAQALSPDPTAPDPTAPDPTAPDPTGLEPGPSRVDQTSAPAAQPPPTVGQPDSDPEGGQPAARQTETTAVPPLKGERAAHRAAAASRAPASVTVGVFPWGNVWIDGAARGKAPVRADLPPGKHTVAGGIDGPDVTRTVRLKPGRTTQVVINLGTGTIKATQEHNGR